MFPCNNAVIWKIWQKFKVRDGLCGLIYSHVLSMFLTSAYKSKIFTFGSQVESKALYDL